MFSRESDKVKILYLAANAVSSDPLALEDEYEQIKDELYSAEYRDLFAAPDAVFSTDVDRLFAGIMRHEPNIIHFSGHGTAAGELVLKASPLVESRLRAIVVGARKSDEPHLLRKEPLVQLLGALNRRIRIVVLNACFSEPQVRAIAEEIDYVIGMSRAVRDDAARLFAVTFYQALGFGRTVRKAFEIASAKLSTFPDQSDLPRLHVRPGVDESKPFLADFGLATGRLRGNHPPAARHIVVRVGSSSMRIHGHFCRRAVIGRSPRCEVSLEDAPPDVGNNHAQLSFSEPLGPYQIRDLDSRHGTFVNGERVAAGESTELRTGDEIRLGKEMRLFFRRQPDGGGEQSASLLRREADGRDLDCHVIAPRDRFVIGNHSGSVASLPDYLLAEGEVLGLTERTEDQLCFLTAHDGRFDHPVKILDGGRIDFPQVSLFFEVPGASEADRAAPTLPPEPEEAPVGDHDRRAEVVTPPVPGEFPRWIKKLDIALVSLAAVALILTVSLIRPANQATISMQWFEDCRRLLEAGKGEGWRHSGPRVPWPPAEPIRICTVATDQDIQAYGLDVGSFYGIPDKVGEGVKVPPEARWEIEAFNQMQGLAPEEPWLLTYYDEGFFGTEFHVSYFKSVDPKNPRINFSHRWADSRPARHVPRLLVLGLCAGLLLSGRNFAVVRYRHGRNVRYQAWLAERTRENFELKKLLDEARKLAHAGQGARALILIKQILGRKPSYDEAIDLRRSILDAEGMTRGTLIADGSGRGPSLPVPADVPDLFLKILQTPYAYRAPRGFDRISLGRQRRRDNRAESEDATSEAVGNDMVIRVPGSDRLSLRISRRHLEFQRIDKEYYVVDHSGGKTYLNGRSLTVDKPYAIVSGDRLSVADVLVFEVQVQAAAEGISVGKVVQVGRDGGPRFEATIGEMITELSHG